MSSGPTLVLGGTGFLGAHVVAAAFARAQLEATFADPRGPEVFGVGRDPALAPRFMDPRDGALWLAADLERAGELERVFEEADPAVIVNCAALSRVAECKEDPARASHLNAELAGRAAELAAGRSARFVHISTDLVFGGPPPQRAGFVEDDPTAPLTTYGQTKAEGEERVLAADATALVVRLPLLYGNSGGRALGASDGLIEAVDRDADPPLFVDEWRTPLEVSNAAEAIVELSAGGASGLLHVAGPQRASRFDLGIAILVAMGMLESDARAAVRASERTESSTVGERPADVSLDASRARALLETELFGLGEGARRAVR